MCVSLESFVLLPVGTEFGAGAELCFQPVDSAAVWSWSRPQADPFCGLDVFGQSRFSLSMVLDVCGADAFGGSLAFGGILGHPVEGAGDCGGCSGRFVRFGLLPVEFADPGVEFGAASVSAGA